MRRNTHAGLYVDRTIMLTRGVCQRVFHLLRAKSLLASLNIIGTSLRTQVARPMARSGGRRPPPRDGNDRAHAAQNSSRVRDYAIQRPVAPNDPHCGSCYRTSDPKRASLDPSRPIMLNGSPP